MVKKRFYVYALVDPRRGKKGAVFYIGKGTWKRKGTNERNQDHLRKSIAGTHYNSKLQNKINKIVKAGLVYGVNFLFSTDSEEKCFAIEIFWIAFYGRTSLCNLTDGGDGPSGCIASEETRAKLSDKSKKAWEDPDYRANQIALLIARCSDPEYRSKMSERMRHVWESEEHRSKLKKIMAVILESQEYKTKRNEGLKRAWQDPDTQFRHSESAKRANSTPEYKAKWKASMDPILSSPEHKAKRSDVVSRRWEDPEYVLKMQGIAKRRWENPEYRERKTSHMVDSWNNDNHRARRLDGMKRSKERSRDQVAPPEERADIMRKIKSWCRQERGRVNKLAALLGVLQSVVSNWLGGRNPSVKNWTRLKEFVATIQ